MSSPFTTLFPDEPKKSAPFADLFPDSGPSERAKFEATREQASRMLPQDAADAFALSRRTGLPAPAILPSLGDVRKATTAEDFDADTFVRDNPLTARWLSADPLNAAVARDDERNLGQLERLLVGRNTGLDRFITAMGQAGLPASRQSAEAFKAPDPRTIQQSGVGQRLDRGVAISLRGQLGRLPLAELQKPEVQAEVQALDALLAEKPEEFTGISRFIAGSAEIAPSIGASMMGGGIGTVAGAGLGAVLGTATFGPGFGTAIGMSTGAKMGGGLGAYYTSFTLEGGNATLDFLQMRDPDGRPINPEIAQAAGTAVGVVAGGLDALSFGVLMKPFAGISRELMAGGIAKAMREVTVRQALTNGVVAWGSSVGTEVLTETAQQGVQLAGEQAARSASNAMSGTSFERIPGGRVTAELAETAVQTFVGMALIGGVGGTTRTITDLQRISQAQADATRLGEIVGVADVSELRKRDPETFRAVVEEQVQGGLEKVGIDAERLTMLLQEQSVPVSQFAQVAGVTEQDIEEAVARGGDLYIPTANLLANVATLPIFEGMKPDLKLRPDGMSQREADAMAKEVEAESAKIQEEMEAIVQNGTEDASGQRVIDELISQITAATEGQPKNKRFTEANIEQTARGIAAFYITQAQRNGVDAYELYASRGYSILGRQQGEGLYDAVQELRRLRTEGTPEQVKEAEAKVRQQGELMEQAAFHGTPHNVDRFSTQFIGTGEGNQAFGWGLYFAQAMGVAEGYRRQLSGDVILVDGNPIGAMRVNEQSALWSIANEGYDEALAKAERTLAAWIKDFGNTGTTTQDDLEQRLVVIKKYAGRDVRFQNPGNLYQVDIPDAAVATYLDWDKPLSEQAPIVREALATLGIEFDAQGMVAYTDALANALTEDGPTSLPKQPANPTGERIYKDLVSNIRRRMMDEKFGGLSPEAREAVARILPLASNDAGMNQRDASLALLAAGIRGIKYLDAGSRGTAWQVTLATKNNPNYASNRFDSQVAAEQYAEERRAEGFTATIEDVGSRNLVVFDESDVTITHRNGEPVTAQERTDFLAQEGMPLGETIDVDGVSRPTTNSTGQPIHPTAEGVRNFWRFYGNSVLLDEDGRPIRTYHGTPDATFAEFKAESFFSPLPDVASLYTSPSASSIATKPKRGDAPAVYPVYVRMERPFDTRNPEIRAEFEAEYFRKFGTGTPLLESGLPDWTEARDLAEWIEETGKDYDGIVVDEGGVPMPDGSVFSRGISFIPRTGEQVKSALGNSGAFGPSADILMQAEPRLQVLHNLTAGNLKFAEQMGGLAVPSLGVTREGMSFPTMGEITLIGTRDLADPEQNPVYTADAYTVTFPRPEYKKAKSKDALALYRKFTDESKRFDDSLANELSDNALGGRPDKSIEMMLRSPAAIATFLAEKGVTLDPVMFPEQRDYNNVDRWASRDVALKALEGYEAEYKEWVENEVLPMHGEPFLKVGRKKVPYTIDNIVEVMTGQGAAAEQTMTFGSGKAAAAAAKQIGSLTEMRNRAEYALGTAEEVAEGRKVSEEALKAYRDAVVPYHGGSTWDALDASMRAVAKFARGRGIKEALRSEGFTSVPNDVLELGKVAGQALLAAPVPYFEAKVERAVSLSEFAGAVIPSSADEGTRKILADAGVQVAEYELGDDAGRNAAIAQLNTQLSGAGMQTLFQGTGRPNAFIIPGVGQQTIALMNGANLSSLLHEFSHDWLVILGEQAAKPDAPAQVRADYAELLKQLGVASTAEIGVEQQENFARMWERYYATAEAPSRALARVFTSFKRWMQKVYKDVREMFVPVSPEVARLFDRMIATDAELELARGANGSGAMLTEADGETLGATPDEMEGYAKAVLWRTAQEEARLIKAVVEDEGKETTEQYQAEAESVRAEVRAELEAQPVHRAFKFLREPDANGKSVKLNVEQFEAEHGKRPRGLQGIWSTAEKAPFAKKEGGDVVGTDAETMALAYGFRDGTAFIDALRAMEDLEVAVERRVREEMRTRFPDLTPFSQPLADEAQRVQHLADTDDVLVRELNLLAKSSGIRAPNVQAVKRAAKAIIAKLKVRDIRPIVYQNAEAKAARLAMEAFKAGDPEKAAFHKRQQLLNHILYREAVKAKEQSAVIERYARGLEKGSAQERIGLAGAWYLDALNAVLDSYEFRTVTNRVINRRAALLEFVEKMIAERGYVPAIPASVMMDAQVTNYRTLPFGQLEDVYDTLKQIDHIASTKNKFLRAQKERTLQEAEDAIESVIAEHHEIKVRGPDYAPTVFKKLTNAVKRWDAWHVKPEFLFRWLDGETPFGAAHRLLFQPIADAQNAEAVMLKASTPEIKRLFALIPKALRKQYDEKLQGPNIPQGFTREQAVALALNWGNDSNRTAVVEGFVDEGKTTPHLTRPQIDALLATLTKAEWDFVQGVWDYIDSYWPQISALEKRLVGVAPEKIEAAPFTQTTADGQTVQLRGGYYPLSYDREFSWSQRKVEAKQQVQEMGEGGFTRKLTKHGHTEERVGSGGKPVDLRLSVFPAHVINVVHDLTHREAVIDVRRLLERPKVRAAIVGSAGPDMYDSLNPWLNRVAAEQNPPASPWENILGHARVGATMVNMGFKVTTAIVQPLGYLQSIEILGTKYARRGMAEFLKNPKQIWEQVKEWSPELESRRTQFDRDVKDAVDKLGNDGWTPEVMQTAFVMTGLLDMFVAVPTFYGGYLKSMETLDPGNHEAAVAYAESAVRMSQSAGGAKDLAMIQGGPESRRMFTMFYSYFSVLYNLFRRSGGMLAQRGVSDLPRFAGSMALLWVLPAVLGELIPQRGPEDDEEELPWLLEQIARYPFASVVGVRDVTGGVASYLTQGRMFYDISPVVSAFESTISTIGGAVQAVGGEPMSRAELKATVEAAGYWGKLPSRQMWITGEALYDWMMGYDIAPKDLLFPRPR